MRVGMKSRLAVALLLSSALTGSATGQGQQADVLITGGTIYDGSEAKPYTGDVAITGDKITYVGPKATVTAKRTIDAKGMIVSPGLIDAHTLTRHLPRPVIDRRHPAALRRPGAAIGWARI